MKNKLENRPWTVVALLWVVALLNYLDRQMLSTLKPSMQVDISELQSATYFGYLMAIFLWVYGLMSPVSGAIADRINRKSIIVVSLFIWSGVTCAMGFATNYQQLFWLRAIMGVSEALYLPAGLSLIADYHSNKTRSLAIGVHLSGLYVGQALGGFGAAAADRLSWQICFQGIGLAGMGYALLLLVLLKEKRAALATAAQPVYRTLGAILHTWRNLLSRFPFWIMILYFSIPSLPGWAVKNWLPTLFADRLQISMKLAGPIATITISMASFIGVLVGGYLADRWSRVNQRGRIYTSAAGLALTIPALLLIGMGDSLYSIVGAACCFGFGFGLFDANNMPILCQIIPPAYRASGYGLLNMAGVFAGAFITELLGKYSDMGKLGLGFTWMALVIFAVLVLQLLFQKPDPGPLNET